MTRALPRRGARPAHRAACAFSAAGFLLLATALPSRAEGPPDPRPLGRDLPAYQAPVDPNAPALPEAAAEPSGTLTLADALRAAVSRSPTLSAFSWEVRARDAELLQSGVLPKPEIALEVEDFAGSGERRVFRGSQTTLSVAQLFELGGKRAKRMRVASLERDLAAWDYEATRLAILTETTKTFVLTLALQERLVLAAEVERLVGESLEKVRATVREGATSPAEASRAGVAAELAAIERAKLEHTLDASRVALAASWGSRSAAFDRLAGDLRALPVPPPFETLAEALAENPDVARWSAELAQREAVLARERAQRTPDVTVGVGPRYYADGSSAALVAGFSVPLPLFDRNRGGILQAEYRVKRAASEQAAAQVAVRAQLSSAYGTLGAARAEIESLRARALPAAEEAFAGAMQGYETGRFRYLEVLDAQRTLFELRANEIDALASYHAAVADVERLIGASLTELTGKP
jgi:cobalt-zinc-cadmium efflux system outer membrane protein